MRSATSSKYRLFSLAIFALHGLLSGCADEPTSSLEDDESNSGPRPVADAGSSSASEAGDSASNTPMMHGDFHFLSATRVADSTTGLGFAGKLEPNQASRVAVGNLVLPASAREGLFLSITTREASGEGSLTVYACGDRPTNGTAIPFSADQVMIQSTVVGKGDICVVSQDASVHVSLDVLGVYGPEGSALSPIDPFRLYETGDDKVEADKEVPLAVGGVNTIPSNAVGAFLSLDVSEADDEGDLRVFQCGDSANALPTLHFRAQEPSAISIPARIGSSGTLCFSTTSPAKVAIDAIGKVSASAGVTTAFSPKRAFDSKAKGDKIVGKQAVPVTTPLNLPTGITAVFATVTISEPDEDGVAALAPCDSPNLFSLATVAFNSGMTRSNISLTAPNGAGEICVYSSAAAHITVDVVGYTK